MDTKTILEQGINLLRYGFDEDEINEFFEAVRKDPKQAEYINKHMSIWGPGLGYDDEKTV